MAEGSPSVAVDVGEATFDASRAELREVVLHGGRRAAHVRVPLGATSDPEALTWEALLVAGQPPLFAGLTGWRRGEPGERSGTDLRFLPSGAGTTVVVGEIREDLRICGDDATLLDPRGLDEKTWLFRGATLQRLSSARRETALPLTATPRRGPAEVPLAPLLLATEASSGSAAALTDGDNKTSWTEGRPGQGQGEFVLLRAPFDVPIARFAVTVTPPVPGRDGAAPETFYLVTTPITYEVTLPEDAWLHPGEAYDVVLPEPVQSSCVALVLADAFARGKPHPDVTVTELAAYSIFDHPGATLAEVAAALSSANDASATAAAALLERAGPAGLQAMGAAYSSLDGRGRALAVNVAASAGSCADSAPFLMSALTDGDEVVRGKALAKLHQPGCGREALPALTAALEDARTRTAVAPLVALFGRERALVPLANGLGLGLSRDRYVLRAAVAFAARGAVPEELGRLLEGAVKRSPEAGLDALRSLSERISDVPREANAAVGELLAKSPPLRTRYLLVDVLVALAHGPDASAKTALAELLLRDPSPEVRAHAMLSLASTSQPEASARAGLSDPAPRVREAALLAMAAAKVSATNGSMEHMLESDPWTFVRVAAALALAALPGTPESDRALGDAVKQLAPRVREQAVLALGAHQASSYRGLVRARMEDAKEDLPVRVAAVRSAGLLCDFDATTTLAHLAVAGASSLDPSEVLLGLAATEALGGLHPKNLPQLFAPLQAKAARPDARAAAARAVATTPACPLP